MATYDPSALTPQLNDMNSTADAAVKSEYGADTLPDLLGKALTSHYASQSNPLYGQRDAALKNFLVEGTTASTKYAPQNQNGVVMAPTEVRSLLAQDRANASVPLVSLNEIIGHGYGGITNVIDSTTKMLAANAKKAVGVAGVSRNKYLDALDALKFKYQTDVTAEEQAAKAAQDAIDNAYRDKTFNEQVRQFNETAKQKSAGSANDMSWLSAFLPQAQGSSAAPNRSAAIDTLWQDEPPAPAENPNKPANLLGNPTGYDLGGNAQYQYNPMLDNLNLHYGPPTPASLFNTNTGPVTSGYGLFGH